MSNGTQFYWYDRNAQEATKAAMQKGIQTYAIGDQTHNTGSIGTLHLSGTGAYGAVHLATGDYFKFTGHSSKESDIPAHIPPKFRYGPFSDEDIVMLHDQNRKRTLVLEGTESAVLGQRLLTLAQARRVAEIAPTLPGEVPMPEIQGFHPGRPGFWRQNPAMLAPA